MLDQVTKRKIDNARDILVGKVPDPKSQVEQITIALIYKFMDDMDKESEEWGGKATFFTGEYEKYAWSRIFDPRLGGFDLINTYSEAIIKMNHNPNIPQLFRDIFKNAYLPYRDPETLKGFLKEINEFHYDHSERLGDAFEYRLSVLGSQGEAGQFRTPRHIIDFIVSVVDPKKNNTIADPACGTAGFLISSYKHILKQNTSADSPLERGGSAEQKRGVSGDKLTPDERKRLLNNFVGYDISPDMVRLSLVNMYLHEFPDPKIHEYDTLTSEEKWNETFDVILANPPFMTPKGGIRPHKRFSVQAKRSEVLFVDYIAEHLNPNGRGGVIVPEGIVFQSANAYKNLRKMLVEDYLWAVVSLPAGVFNPYSGVKTSILLMDKMLSKKTDKILFVKIENDGFDLGAQRRPIDKNDLPKALNFIKSYHQAVINGTEVENTDFVHVVDKKRIAESGVWNLSGESYKDNKSIQNHNWEMVEFTNVCTFEYGKGLPKKDRKGGDFPVIGSNGISGWHNEYLIEAPAIIIGRKGSAGEVNWIEKNCFPIDTTYYVKLQNIEYDLRFLYFILKEMNLQRFKDGAGIPGLNRNDVYNREKIPFPPIDVQKAIVAEIDSYQKIIDGARQVVDNYKPTIKIDPDWEMVKLGEVCQFKRGPFGGSLKKDIFVKDGYKVYEQKHAIKNDFEIGDYYITEDKYNEMIDFALKLNDLIISCSGTMGRIAIVPEKIKAGIINQALLKLTPKFDKVNPIFIKYILESNFIQNKYFRNTAGAAIQNVASVKVLKSIEIPLPPLSVQQEIVSQIEEEQEMVNANKKLITIYEQKIKDNISEVWGDSKK